MAEIGVNKLDGNLIRELNGIMKKRLFSVYNRVPNDRAEIEKGIDDATMSSLINEVVIYYDGLFDDDPVTVNIEKREFAALLN